MKNSNYRNELKYVPHHKTGIKLLDIQQLENLFPNYEGLLQRIEEHREKLQQMQYPNFERDSQYNLMYDNIFSIFGKRGAGKTSAMFTLKKILESENPCDIVLPIVMPEMIPQECSMIGWILSLLEEKVEELDRKMQEKENAESKFFRECRHSSKNSLKQEYEKVKELCFSQFYQVEGNESFSTVLLNKERQTQNSFNFSKQLGKFWGYLQSAIQATSEQQTEPLIYIIFDDVDLLPEAVTTLLSTIIKYLSHPNIIVFVTADEELLYDVISSSMNKKLGKYEELQMHSEVSRTLSGEAFFEVPVIFRQEIEQKWQAAKQIPRLYVDKVLPPSSRYYLKTFESFEAKSTFIERVEYNGNQPKPNGSRIILEKIFTQEIDRYVSAVGYTKGNFLLSKGEFIKAYFAFWGNTSRQLVNEVLILNSFITRLIEVHDRYKEGSYTEEIYLQNIYNSIYDFSYNTLISMGNIGLSIEEIRELLEELLVFKTGKWGIYLNYSYLLEYAQNIYEGSKINNLEETIKQPIIFTILLFFLENILYIEAQSTGAKSNQRTKIHGRGVLVDILDKITAPGESLVCKNHATNIDEFLKFYDNLLDEPEVLMKFDLMQPRKVRNYLYKLPMNSMDIDLSKYSRENPKWLRSIVKILHFANEGIYDIGKSEILLCKFNNQSLALEDPYIDDKLKEFKSDLVKALSFIPGDLMLQWGSITKFASKKIMDESKKESARLNNLHEIEKVVLEKMPNAKKGSQGYLSAGIYRNVTVDKVAMRLEKLSLLSELEKVIERIIKNYNAFRCYEVTDMEYFRELLDRLENFAVGLRKRIKRQGKVISISEMNELLSMITNELGFRKWQYDIHGRNDLPEGALSTSELEEIGEKLVKCISISIQTEEDIERAINIVIDGQNFMTLQRFYIWSYLQGLNGDVEKRIDPSAIPYKDLYSEIKKELQKNDTGYLTQLLRRNIEEGILKYVNMLMEG